MLSLVPGLGLLWQVLNWRKGLPSGGHEPAAGRATQSARASAPVMEQDRALEVYG